MLSFRKHIAIVFVFALLIPMSLQTLHALEKHEHSICKSVLDTHLHKKDLDCSDLHQLLETNTVSFTADFSPRTQIIYSETIISEILFISGNYLNKKSSRGPPALV